MSVQRVQLGSLILLALAAGCGSDPVSETPFAGPGTVRVNISFESGGIPLERLGPSATAPFDYFNAAGNNFGVEKFEALISNVRLVGIDGTETNEHVLSDAFYANAFENSTNSFENDEVPSGTKFQNLVFHWGIEEANNTPNFLDTSFDGMEWPDINGGGYHCMRFEGRWVDDSDTETGFALHTGRLDREGQVTDGTFEVTLALTADATNYTLIANETREINLTIDVQKWMDGPLYDMNVVLDSETVGDLPLSGPVMPSHPAQQLLKDNGVNVFCTVDCPEDLGGFRLDLNYMVGNEVLQPLPPVPTPPFPYTNLAGNEFGVSRFEYIMTDVRLTSDDGTSTVVAPAFYSDAFVGEQVLDAQDVAVGVYTGLSFQWGVRGSNNVSNFLSMDYDGMLWPDVNGGGYHCMRFEGRWIDDQAAEGGFALHTGRLDRAGTVTNGSFEVNLVLPSAITITDGATLGAVLTIDLLNWMNDPLYDFNQVLDSGTVGDLPLSGPVMPSHPAQQLLLDNGDDVFSVDIPE